MGTRGSATWVRETYHVPAKRGMTIRVAKKAARIVGFRGGYLRIRYPEEPILGIRSAHPTWSVEYPPFEEE